MSDREKLDETSKDILERLLLKTGEPCRVLNVRQEIFSEIVRKSKDSILNSMGQKEQTSLINRECHKMYSKLDKVKEHIAAEDCGLNTEIRVRLMIMLSMKTTESLRNQLDATTKYDTDEKITKINCLGIKFDGDHDIQKKMRQIKKKNKEPAQGGKKEKSDEDAEGEKEKNDVKLPIVMEVETVSSMLSALDLEYVLHPNLCIKPMNKEKSEENEDGKDKTTTKVEKVPRLNKQDEHKTVMEVKTAKASPDVHIFNVYASEESPRGLAHVKMAPSSPRPLSGSSTGSEDQHPNQAKRMLVIQKQREVKMMNRQQVISKLEILLGKIGSSDTLERIRKWLRSEGEKAKIEEVINFHFFDKFMLSMISLVASRQQNPLMPPEPGPNCSRVYEVMHEMMMELLYDNNNIIGQLSVNKILADGSQAKCDDESISSSIYLFIVATKRGQPQQV